MVGTGTGRKYKNIWKLRGAFPEQRSSVVSLDDSAKKAEKGECPVKIKNNLEASKFKKSLQQIFLVLSIIMNIVSLTDEINSQCMNYKINDTTRARP